MLGNNIKVHFAGADNSFQHFIAMELAEIHYSLFTCYPFIKNKNSKSNLKFSKEQLFIPKIIDSLRKHVIMDSGLFTLMFGAEKGKVQTLERLIEWQDTTANFVNQNNLKCTCVEIDCQKILGVEQAWFLRERMKKVMPNNKHINVWHLEDGKKGLDRLIEFSDYIAISVPELRLHTDNAKKHTIYLSNYIKNKKPKIDIHLLGCTQKNILKETKFCTSSDSTSWLAANQYGDVKTKNKKYHVNQIKQSEREKITPDIISLYNKFSSSPLKESTMKYIQDAYFSIKIQRKIYEDICGNQN